MVWRVSDSTSDFDIGAEQLRECEAAYSHMQLQQAKLDQLRQMPIWLVPICLVIPVSLAIHVSLRILVLTGSELDSDEELDELSDCDQLHKEDV